MNTQAEIHRAFWETYPDLTRRTTARGHTLPQNAQPTDTRCAFVDFVDHLVRDGVISEALAGRVTL